MSVPVSSLALSNIAKIDHTNWLFKIMNVPLYMVHVLNMLS